MCSLVLTRPVYKGWCQMEAELTGVMVGPMAVGNQDSAGGIW